MKSKLLRLSEIVSKSLILIACVCLLSLIGARLFYFPKHFRAALYISTEEVYYVLAEFFIYNGFFVLAFSILIGILRLGFIWKPGPFSRTVEKHGFRPVLYLLAAFAALLFLSFIFERIADAIPEISEYPRTVALRIFSGLFERAAQFAFEGAFAMFLAWCRSRLKKRRQSHA